MTPEEFDFQERAKLFQAWLSEQTLSQQQMLMSLCANTKQGIDAVRLKYGALEAYLFIGKAFHEFMTKSREEFAKEWLQTPIETGETDD